MLIDEDFMQTILDDSRESSKNDFIDLEQILESIDLLNFAQFQECDNTHYNNNYSSGCDLINFLLWDSYKDSRFIQIQELIEYFPDSTAIDEENYMKILLKLISPTRSYLQDIEESIEKLENDISIEKQLLKPIEIEKRRTFIESDTKDINDFILKARKYLKTHYSEYVSEAS